MRFLLPILSLLILFQPSWALGMPMPSVHQLMDGETLAATTSVEHCQSEIAEIDISGPISDGTHHQENHPPAGCHNAGSSAAGLTTSATVFFSHQYRDVVYHGLSISFQSHTESPEIRPPHNSIRF